MNLHYKVFPLRIFDFVHQQKCTAQNYGTSNYVLYYFKTYVSQTFYRFSMFYGIRNCCISLHITFTLPIFNIPAIGFLRHLHPIIKDLTQSFL